MIDFSRDIVPFILDHCANLPITAVLYVHSPYYSVVTGHVIGGIHYRGPHFLISILMHLYTFDIQRV